MKRLVSVLGLVSVFLLVSFMATSAVYAAGAVQPLVTTQWVADNTASIKIIDVSKKGYGKGHIPGAMQVKWGTRFLPPKQIIWCSA